ncbi:MAG TPA: GAF domain-containing protein [Anaerolineales bacterium]|nr:GAF domain-containing protein [Anaerolineales bacterium]
MKQIRQAVETVGRGEYDPDSLADLVLRTDEIGQLARAVDAMGRAVAFRYRQLQLLGKVIPIGVALSAEKDFDRLLESLVVEAQEVTGADAGTLYLLKENALQFVIVRNGTLNITMGGTSGHKITFSPLPLYHPDGTENRSNIATYTALTRQKVTIADAYETSEGFDFSGPRSFDQNTGYHSKSFLTIPLEGPDQGIIGVLQLINAMDPDTGEIISFPSDNVLDLLVLLASAALDGYIREEKLRAEIARLRIEIDEKYRARQVAEITDTRYFKDLQKKARQMRSQRRDK